MECHLRCGARRRTRLRSRRARVVAESGLKPPWASRRCSTLARGVHDRSPGASRRSTRMSSRIAWRDGARVGGSSDLRVGRGSGLGPCGGHVGDLDRLVLDESGVDLQHRPGQFRERAVEQHAERGLIPGHPGVVVRRVADVRQVVVNRGSTRRSNSSSHRSCSSRTAFGWRLIPTPNGRSSRADLKTRTATPIWRHVSAIVSPAMPPPATSTSMSRGYRRPETRGK